MLYILWPLLGSKQKPGPNNHNAWVSYEQSNPGPFTGTSTIFVKSYQLVTVLHDLIQLVYNLFKNNSTIARDKATMTFILLPQSQERLQNIKGYLPHCRETLRLLTIVMYKSIPSLLNIE